MPVHIYHLVVALALQVVAPGGRRKTDKEGRRGKREAGKERGKGREGRRRSNSYIYVHITSPL